MNSLTLRSAFFKNTTSVAYKFIKLCVSIGNIVNNNSNKKLSQG